MPSRLSFKYAGAAFLFALSVATSSPALAGFQWIAPSDSVPAPAPVVMQPVPTVAATAAPEIISPVVITATPSVPVTVAQPPGVTMPPSVAVVAPVQTQATVITPVATPAPVVAADNSVVLGFARSVPLAVALRQILPSGYAFSIDQDVDMGTLVSFQGGRSWRDTLRDSLEPVGLVAREHGQMVQVSFAGRTAAMPIAPAPVAEVHPFAAMAPSTPPASLPNVPSPGPAYQANMAPRVLVAPPAAEGVVPMGGPVPMGTPIVGGPMVGAPVMAGGPTTDSWTAERGETLRKVLENWSRRANVEFDWFSEYDYPLEASVAFSGGFEGAVRSLLTGFEGAHPQPVAELHSNSNLGQMVLVVQTRGNTNSD